MRQVAIGSGIPQEVPARAATRVKPTIRRKVTPVRHTQLSRQQPKHTGTLTAVLRGDSRAVLLTGVALNWAGAVKLAREVWLSDGRVGAPADYDQLKPFTSGTAATFGAFYLYLFAAKKPVLPLLMFGASLKTWALVTSGMLHAQGRLNRANFLSFGVTNGVLAGLFWAHIAQEARDNRKKATAAAA